MGRVRTNVAAALTFSSIVLFSSQSYSESVCTVSDQKKQILSALLCGQGATEPEYRFSGPDCAAKTARKRLEDSAVQILAYKRCGEVEFSNKLAEATLKTVKFIELLSPCAGNQIDITKIMTEATSAMETRAHGLTCDASLRSLLQQRRSFFEAQIATANNTDIIPLILDKFQIDVDSQGNLRDR